MEKVAGRKEWKKTSDRGCINTNGISRGGYRVSVWVKRGEVCRNASSGISGKIVRIIFFVRKNLFATDFLVKVSLF